MNCFLFGTGGGALLFFRFGTGGAAHAVDVLDVLAPMFVPYVTPPADELVRPCRPGKAVNPVVFVFFFFFFSAPAPAPALAANEGSFRNSWIGAELQSPLPHATTNTPRLRSPFVRVAVGGVIDLSSRNSAPRVFPPFTFHSSVSENLKSSWRSPGMFSIASRSAVAISAFRWLTSR